MENRLRANTEDRFALWFPTSTLGRVRSGSMEFSFCQPIDRDFGRSTGTTCAAIRSTKNALANRPTVPTMHCGPFSAVSLHHDGLTFARLIEPRLGKCVDLELAETTAGSSGAMWSVGSRT